MVCERQWFFLSLVKEIFTYEKINTHRISPLFHNHPEF